jgi:hypothetical protein
MNTNLWPLHGYLTITSTVAEIALVILERVLRNLFAICAELGLWLQNADGNSTQVESSRLIRVADLLALYLALRLGHLHLLHQKHIVQYFQACRTGDG